MRSAIRGIRFIKANFNTSVSEIQQSFSRNKALHFKNIPSIGIIGTLEPFRLCVFYLSN